MHSAVHIILGGFFSKNFGMTCQCPKPLQSKPKFPKPQTLTPVTTQNEKKPETSPNPKPKDPQGDKHPSDENSTARKLRTGSEDFNR